MARWHVLSGAPGRCAPRLGWLPSGARPDAPCPGGTRAPAAPPPWRGPLRWRRLTRPGLPVPTWPAGSGHPRAPRRPAPRAAGRRKRWQKRVEERERVGSHLEAQVPPRRRQRWRRRGGSAGCRLCGGAAPNSLPKVPGSCQERGGSGVWKEELRGSGGRGGSWGREGRKGRVAARAPRALRHRSRGGRSGPRAVRAGAQVTGAAAGMRLRVAPGLGEEKRGVRRERPSARREAETRGELGRKVAPLPYPTVSYRAPTLSPGVSGPGLGPGVPSVPPTYRLTGLCASGVQNAAIKIVKSGRSGKGKRNGKDQK